MFFQHDRLKILSFLAVDVLVSLALFYTFYVTFFSIFIASILLIQLYLLFSVFSHWRELQKKHEKRMENQEERKRQGRQQGFVRENVQAQVEVEVPAVDGNDRLEIVTENT